MSIFVRTKNRFFGHFLVKNGLFWTVCGQKPTFLPYLFLPSDSSTIVKCYVYDSTKVEESDW